MKGETLEERYKDDPGLLRHYKRKLLIPGWAGELDEMEIVYVASHAPGRQTLKQILGQAVLIIGRGPWRGKNPLCLGIVKAAWKARKNVQISSKVASSKAG